jgi:hypothetical protein
MPKMILCDLSLAHIQGKKSEVPDGIFSNQKSQFGQILEGLAMEDVDIFYGHLVYFTAIWYILWSFGKFYGYLVYFSPFWYVVP